MESVSAIRYGDPDLRQEDNEWSVLALFDQESLTLVRKTTAGWAPLSS